MDREAKMTEWTDGRLDELSKKVDDGFAEVKADMRELGGRIDKLGGRLDQLSGRFDKLQHTLMQVAVAATVGAGAMVVTSIGIVFKVL